MPALVLAAALATLTTVGDVFPRGGAHSELRTVDPVTLAPAAPAIRLEGFLRGWTRSPGGGRLALGVSNRGRVQIVGARTTRVVRTGRRTAWWLLAWPRARRVVGLGYGSGDGSPLVVVDPVRGRVVRHGRVAGYVGASVSTRDGLALIVSPPGRIADAELVLVDAEGSERRIALPGVPAGFVPPGEDGVAREVAPGLAVRDVRAYIATGARVVEVDLASGAQTEHPLRAAAPAGTEPAARARSAKRSEGEQRQIDFVGDRQLAVSGVDLVADRVRPIGLRVVDIRTWGVRLVAPRGRGFVGLPSGGLAAWPAERGLVLLDADGRRRATALRGRPLVQVQTAGRYAYAVEFRPRHRTYVVDLRDGRVVRTLPTARPGIVLR